MTKRDEAVGHALWGVDHEPDIHYSQGPHRFDAVHTPRALPLWTDCSAFVTLCYSWAGAPDPNGLGYNGTGYTGTLLGHLEHIDLADARRGDLAVFGPGGGDHVVMLIEEGSDPMTVSHGQERGPIRVRLSVEKRAHRSPMTVLRGAGLDDAPEPPPEDDDMTDADRKMLEDISAAVGRLDVTINDKDSGLVAQLNRLETDLTGKLVDVRRNARTALVALGVDPKDIEQWNDATPKVKTVAQQVEDLLNASKP